MQKLYTFIVKVKLIQLTITLKCQTQKVVCFNSASAGRRISHCKSRPCSKCRQKHHIWICVSTRSSIDQLSTANKSSQDKMKQETRAKLKHSSSNISCHSWEEAVRIMVDTGATSFYVCTNLMTKLGIKLVRREQRCIEQMYGTMKKTVEVYQFPHK